MVLFSPLCLGETEVTTACGQTASATLVSLQGSLYFDPDGHGRWHAAQLNQALCEGSRVRVEADSRATLLLPSGITLRLSGGSVLSLNEIGRQNPTLLDLVKGFVHFISRTPKQLQITTPVANAGPEGTEFALQADATSASLWVYEGGVRFFNTQGEIRLHPGESGQTLLGQAPRAQIDIKPRDAVSWALYYPPLLNYSEQAQAADPELRAAITEFHRGRTDLALTALSALPPERQSLQYLKVRGAMRLSVGQTDAALQDIRALLAANPHDADALALHSILALSQNRKAEAEALAAEAVAADGGSAAAHSALSYARQGRFDLEQALASAERAAELAPQDALVWARLAELQLALGRRQASRDSADKAFQLNPDLERTQTVAGFSQLFDTEIDQARRSFETAIRLDSSSPLARLGLGLAKIRGGDLEQGRQELEIAAVLDPENSLIRSYLGKAYYEERRDRLAADQLELAKERDPNDPTPYFYDAIRKQTTNRPIEALADMQQAVELNDKRGVYRSKLLLDEDAAARTANLARIYNDLGFGRVALKQAWNALGYNSADPTAHRFLADAYQGLPGQRVARASELLQAQLLQPINITPVQPQLTNENIGILNNTGPGSLSVNEYDPLYTANGAHIVLNGAYGSRDTKTDSAIVSGVYNNLSMSLGQFHYQTDGFRQNDDYQQNIYDAFAQYAFSSDFNMQVELKSENLRTGDLPTRLNGVHDADLRQTIKQNTARLGGHYKIDSEQDVIGSFFYTSRRDVIHNNTVRYDKFDPFFDNMDILRLGNENRGHQTELQYIYHPDSFELIFGVGHLEMENRERINNTNIFINPPPSPLIDITNTTSQTHHFNSYLYTKKYLPGNVTTTVGLSFDYLDNDLTDFNGGIFFDDGSSIIKTQNPKLAKRQQLNPKFGISWSPFQNLTLRGAVFKTLTRRLAANQTIEPTQIAGFNQFFDDNYHARAWRYGVGLDYRPTQTLFAGGELSWRDSRQPLGNVSNPLDRNELGHLAYLYWAPLEWLALRAEYRFDKHNRSFALGHGDDIFPQSVATHQVPLAVNFFHPSGVYTRFTGTYVNQQVANVANSLENPLSYRSENFWTFDTSVGYRFPKRFGTINFEVRNLFDNKFNYQSTFDGSGPQLSPYIPERQLFVKLSLFY
nr:FecR domain-containing protein [Methylomonas sp. SURF-1]